MSTQFTKFIVAGGAGTTLHYLVLIVLVSLLNAAPGLAAFAGAAAGACLVYALNYRFTFASKQGHLHTAPRFLALAAIGALLNGAIVGMLSQAGLYFLLSQFVATAVVLVLNFIVSKLWIFR